jgi:hypothetical protein
MRWFHNTGMRSIRQILGTLPALNSARIPVMLDLGFRIRFLGLGLGLPFRTRIRIESSFRIRVRIT